MAAYYNEFDEYAAQWLRNLIAAGHIADGDVDQRSINDVSADDLANYTQCHFFAGIGVWSHALRLAGWDDDRPVWTGSCPCQPFSAAGEGKGHADERHLWPRFFELIAERKPPIVFGEQVEAAIRHGWLDLVQTDMEGIGYAFAAAGIPAAGVGAPHIRQRLYFVADSNQKQRGWRADSERLQSHGTAVEWDQGDRIIKSNSTTDRLDNSDDARLEGQRSGHQAEGGRVGAVRSVAEAGEFGGLADTASTGSFPGALTGIHSGKEGAGSWDGEPKRSGADDRLDYAECNGRGARRNDDTQHDGQQFDAASNADRPGPTNGHWRDADWLFCRDGKLRPVEPGTFPLAHGITSRLVYTCAKCKTETVKYENLRTLRKFPAGLEGLRSEAILFNAVLREVDNINSENRSMRALSGAIQICSGVMQSMQCDGSTASASHRQESQKQRAKQYRDIMSKLSCQRASPDRATNANVQGMPETISSPQMEEQYLFCPVCAGMGPHKCQQEMGPQRSGRLRAYGNAIVPQVAQAFIEAFLEVRP